MSLGHGTKVTTKDLVFAYDMDNLKSNKGIPTKNELLTTTSWGGDGSNQTAFTKGYDLIQDKQLQYQGLDTVLWRPGGNLNCYLDGSQDIDYSSTSTVWTFSCFVKREDGLPITSLNVYMYYPSSDGSANGVIQDMGDGWYRVSRTRTGSSNYITLVGFTGFASNVKYYLSGPMLSKTSVPAYPLDAQETRSNTDSLVDWKNGTGINPSNLVYTADNTFKFDGTDSYIRTPVNHSYLESSTLEVVLKFDNIQNNTKQLLFGYRHNVGYSRPPLGSIFTEGVNFQASLITASQTYREVNDSSLSSPIEEGKVYHITLVKDVINGLLKIYRNGVLGGTVTFDSSTYGQWSSAGNYIGSNNLDIGLSYNSASGQGWQNYFNGTIYSAKVYGGVLTDDEIKRNYKATLPKYRIGLTPEYPASNASEILEKWPQAPSGIYYIKMRTTGTVVPVYCDMVTEGGGWMLLVQNSNINGATKMNYTNYALHNETNPPIASSRSNATYSYSILQYADEFKDPSKTFEYMIDALERGRWGGIWTANDPTYTFNQTVNTATNITLTTKFDANDWDYNDSGIEQRMPWVSSITYNGKLTTSASATNSWWGTIIEAGSSFSPAPWMSSGVSGTSSTQSPGVIWYWMRSQ